MRTFPQDDKLDVLCDPAIWKKAIDRAVEKGRDRTVLSYLADPAGRASVIDAIAEGRYAMRPPRTLYVDKLTGLPLTRKEAVDRDMRDVRELYAMSCPLDAVTMVAVSGVYWRLYGDRVHPACRSYREGVGVGRILHDDLIPRLVSGESGYKLDISKYFDSVNRESLDACLKSMDTGSALDRLVWSTYHDDRVYLGRDAETTPRYMSIRQGNPFGVLLADLVLRDADEEMSSPEYGALYLRYSDDVILVGRNADAALARFREIIAAKGLVLKAEKVERISTDAPFTFLGCRISGGSVDISAKSAEKVKRQVRLITKPRRSVRRGDRTEQSRAIRAVSRLLYGHDRLGHSWAEYFFSVISPDSAMVRTLDEFCKDRIKGVFTGKQGEHVRNLRRTPNDVLRSLGYKSLVRRFRLYKADRDVYRADLARAD